MAYLDTLSQKKLAAAQSAKEQNELRSMLTELKKMQMASLMGSQGKSTVILTDQTDLGDKLKGMVDGFTTAVKSMDTSAMDKSQLSELQELKRGLAEVKKAIQQSKSDHSGVIQAIKSLDLNVEAPVVNVPAPNVTVKAPHVDLSPLQETLRAALTPEPTEEKLDLDCYRAQDITESGDIQYVGFQHPEGKWYIIENDTANNRMRYVFGSGDYAAAFADAASYEYTLLDEAVARATA